MHLESAFGAFLVLLKSDGVSLYLFLPHYVLLFTYPLLARVIRIYFDYLMHFVFLIS
jgi:hypothetical protein